ncbi:MAG: hypothetical protein WB773_21500, partial [Isosphaeraceae bacterium]
LGPGRGFGRAGPGKEEVILLVDVAPQIDLQRGLPVEERAVRGAVIRPGFVVGVTSRNGV